MNALTTIQLLNICPSGTKENIERFIPHLNILMPKYDINTIHRVRHFIAQLAHESNQFYSVAEKYNGNPKEYFKKYDLRADLGNKFEGDGMKFKGRGLIQVTGRFNYTAASIDIFKDETLIIKPETLEQPYYAVEISCWFWKVKHLNSLADTDNIKAITAKINGGLNGLSNRIKFYNEAIKYIK